jgi:FixJ family two-component response regulator
VIIFSASTHLRKFAKEAGADDFIEKPFKTKELLGLIERQLSKSLR